MDHADTERLHEAHPVTVRMQRRHMPQKKPILLTFNEAALIKAFCDFTTAHGPDSQDQGPHLLPTADRSEIRCCNQLTRKLIEAYDGLAFTEAYKR